MICAIAFEWFSVRAEMGDSHSQAMLSRIYAMGEGVSKDLAKAHMWVNFAAIDGAKKRDMRGC